MTRRGFNPNWPLVYSSLAVITVSNWIPFWTQSADRLEHLVWALSAVCVANMLILMREAYIFREPGTALVNACGAIFATFYLGALAAFLIELRWAGQGLVALATHIAAAKCGDSGAYFGGRAFGRHKLCPWLSPNKTVEGAIAGLIASVLGTLAVLALGAGLSGKPPVMNWAIGSLFGLTVGVLGMVGDLIESLIKRDCQQKDASELVPGFGGALDVLDSPLFSAPAAFGFWYWLG
jgi:phosphatidate cytidylyltransferase